MISSTKRIWSLFLIVSLALLGTTIPINAEAPCPCDDDPFYYDPFTTTPGITINGTLRAYADASSKDLCGFETLPTEAELWDRSRQWVIDDAAAASSKCTAFKNHVLLGGISDSDSSACGGSADADVNFVGNYEAYGTSRSVGVSMVHGAFHIPYLSGGFSADCCDTDNPCAHAFVGSETTEPFSVSVKFSVCKATKVIIDANLTVLGCEDDLFDFFSAQWSLSGVTGGPLFDCFDGDTQSLILAPGDYTLSASFDYTITTGWWKNCYDEQNEDSKKPVILLDVNVLAGPGVQGTGNDK